MLWTIGYSYLSGVKGKIFSSEKKDHFLDYAKDCDEDVVEDAKYVYPLIVMFVPMIFFWAMFDMKGSKWVLTGTQVNVHNVCNIALKGDTQLSLDFFRNPLTQSNLLE